MVAQRAKVCNQALCRWRVLRFFGAVIEGRWHIETTVKAGRMYFSQGGRFGCVSIVNMRSFGEAARKRLGGDVVAHLGGTGRDRKLPPRQCGIAAVEVSNRSKGHSVHGERRRGAAKHKAGEYLREDKRKQRQNANAAKGRKMGKLGHVL